MSLLDKIFVVEGEEIEFRFEIKERMERVFNDAVEREHDKHFIDGISVVLDTMNLMGMRESRILIEQRLVSDNVITAIDEVEEQEQKTNNESKCYADILAGMIG